MSGEYKPLTEEEFLNAIVARDVERVVGEARFWKERAEAWEAYANNIEKTLKEWEEYGKHIAKGAA